MPGDRSLFRQIQVVLDYSRERKHDSKDSLSRYIAGRHTSSFVYFWRDRESDKIRHGLSERSVETAIEMALALKLLEERNGAIALTRAGIAACDASRFKAILGRQVAALMDDNDVGVVRIEKIIQGLLSHRPPNVPTADKILEHIEPETSKLSVNVLKRLLVLLGQTAMLDMSQRRIYLPSQSGHHSE